jgi:Sec-independent protein secretion pathway component TatC
VATCITPPDVVYQLLVSICIIIIYELILIYLLLKVEFINLSKQSIKTY